MSKDVMLKEVEGNEGLPDLVIWIGLVIAFVSGFVLGKLW